MTTQLSLEQTKKRYHGNLKSYLIGFFTSLFLTIISFALVAFDFIASPSLIYAVIGLAILQAVIQFIFFFHMGQEAKPRWELWVFCSMVGILLIIAAGSLWVMNDLNKRVMPHMHKGMTHD